ncbi:hypothetical protein QYE76_036482 [Lolium multiflorum]|uniref:Uncharacterized protein n=1 Tax=Lolium multiflorum TaxID=4521 RepID=A0AAD8R4H1_LOLMU|nr:hypothetical protein QYE76_036482 [Lolium multiflorum]
MRSCPFIVGGYLWFIQCFPNGCKPENAGYTSVRFRLLHKDAALAKPLKLQFKFSFVDQIDKQESKRIRAGKVYEFLGSRHIGFARCRFVKREVLEKSEHLKDDSFTIRCDIVMVEEFNSVVTGTSSPSIEVPPSEMQQHFSSLLLSEEGADVTFDVSGEKIAAHRCVLAARSVVFKAELFGNMKEGMPTTSVIEVEDMDAQVFRAMLSFIYSDSLPEVKEEDDYVMWQHLLIAADRYDLLRLRLICEEKLCEYLDVSAVPTILALAEQHSCRGLKERCLAFLNSPANLQKVTAIGGLDSLATCCPSVLKDLIAKLASLRQEE